MTPRFITAGVDYCTLHCGIREADEVTCDNADTCQTCNGLGEVIDEDGDPHMQCDQCEGAGRELCDLRELGYMAADDPENPRRCDRCDSFAWLTSALNSKGEPVWLCRKCIDRMLEEG